MNKMILNINNCNEYEVQLLILYVDNGAEGNYLVCKACVDYKINSLEITQGN